MQLTVVSHKPCWPSPQAAAGYASDGGFPFQMHALAELFDAIRIVVPCGTPGPRPGEILLTGRNLSVVPLTPLAGSGFRRKLRVPLWLARNGVTLMREVRRAGAVHVPIPGDVGSIGMVLAWLLRRPLCVRHCGNWLVPRTAAERFWRWFMERVAGRRNVMFATGGAQAAPSRHNPNVRWIFSTSLRARELEACGVRRDAVSNGHLRLIVACRQEWEKGTGTVIESLPLLLPEFPGLSLDVVGDGGARAEFEALAAARGVADRVTFHGKVGHEAVLSLLATADLFCYPTTASEGFPKVVLEALACGLPVITTRVSVLPELLDRGCGYLLDQPTPAALAEAVRTCATDAARYRGMSARAVEVAHGFSLERWSATIAGYLRTAWGPLRADG